MSRWCNYTASVSLLKRTDLRSIDGHVTVITASGRSVRGQIIEWVAPAECVIDTDGSGRRAVRGVLRETWQRRQAAQS